MEGSKKGSSSSSGGGGFGGAGGASMFPFGSPINASRRSLLSPGAYPPLAGDQGQGQPAPRKAASSSPSPHVLRGRVRAQDVYGGPLTFGGGGGGTPTRNGHGHRSFTAEYSFLGGSSSGSRIHATANGGDAASAATPSAVGTGGAVVAGRKSRLMFSASPYHSAASARILQRSGKAAAAPTTQQPRSNTPSPSSCGSSGAASSVTGAASAAAAAAEGMSSTARLIFDTLDKMSTPLRDAQKMPLPIEVETKHQTPSRAEKRKLIAQQLNLSSSSPSRDGTASVEAGSSAKRARRRPNLGGRPVVGGAADMSSASMMLKGPPTRSTAFMSPTPARTTPRGPTPAAAPSKKPPPTPVQPEDPVPSPLPTTAAAAKSSQQPRIDQGATATSSLAPPPPPFAAGGGGGGFIGGGGGKMKSISARSSLRQQSLAGAAPTKAAASALTSAGGMPNITFAKKSSAAATLQDSTTTSSEAAAAPPPPPRPQSKQFSFSLPLAVACGGWAAGASSGAAQAAANTAQQFQFAAPQRVNSRAVGASLSGAGVSDLTRSTGVVLPDLMTHNSGSSAAPLPPTSSSSLSSSSSTSSSFPLSHKMPVMKMPSSASVAPKPSALLKAGRSVMEILGGNMGKLPDVTSTGRQSNDIFGGIKPASELKSGSVMSILGGKSDMETPPAWDPKFKNSQKPWQ